MILVELSVTEGPSGRFALHNHFGLVTNCDSVSS